MADADERDEHTVEPQLSAVALEALEQHYTEVLRELQAEPQLEPFRNEYECIHRLLGKSHEGERRLVEKVRELQAELGSHASKIDAAMGLSREDEETIANLRKEIEKAWALADSAHEREKESKELIEALKKQIFELDRLVEKSAGLSAGQETYLKDLLEAKKEMEEENMLLKSRLTRLTAEHHEVTKRFATTKQAEESSKAALDTKLAEYNALLKALEEAQRDRNTTEEKVRTYRSSAEEAVLQIDRTKFSMERLEQEERTTRASLDKITDDNAQLARRVEEKKVSFKQEAERLSKVDAQNKGLRKRLPELAQALAEKEEELGRVRKQLKEAEGQARAQQTQLEELVRMRDTLVLQANEHNASLSAAVRELNEQQKLLRTREEEARRAMKEKERALAENTNKENERGRAETEQTVEVGKRKRLEQELDLLLTENEKMRKQVYQLEQHSNKEVSSAQEVMLTYHTTLDGIRTKRNEARHLRDVLALHGKKLKVQQELVERVKSDRNSTEKQLKETEKEWQQLQTQHAGKRDEIEVLKSSLIKKEAELCQLHAVNSKLLSDTANTEQRALHLREDCANGNKRIKLLSDERDQLELIIAKCDAEKQKEGMKLTAIVNERNVLAAQLLQRNEEINALYDKIQLQQANLARGAVEYNRVVQRIEAARDRLMETRLRCRLALVKVSKLENLRRRALAANRDLLQAQTQTRALTDEVQGLTNVHRWRQLENTDPALMDSIAKVQVLQRKLVAKQDECTAKLRYIDEKEREYQALRAQLARLPGPEAAEDLALYSENIGRRREQITDMDGELKEAEQHAEVLAEEVRDLAAELLTVKAQYYAAKAKQDNLARERRVVQQAWGTPLFAQTAMAARASPSPPGTAGGGSQSARGLGGSSGGGGGGVKKRAKKTQRQAMAEKEDELLAVLTTGQSAPSFPLQKPKNQRLFVGGGFSLSH